MVAIRSLIVTVVVSAVAVAAAAVPEAVEAVEARNKHPVTYEYSLHASSTNKHLGSCHFAKYDGPYEDFESAPEYKCNIKTRKCRANGPGAKQAFVKNCWANFGAFIQHKWN